MAPDFVRYSPEIETFDPELSEHMTKHHRLVAEQGP